MQLNVQDLVGVDYETFRPLLEATTLPFRVVQHGKITYFCQADHNPQRINLRLDDEGRVTDAYLG